MGSFAKEGQLGLKIVPNFTEFFLVTSKLVLCLVYQRFTAILLLSRGSLAINQLVHLIQFRWWELRCPQSWVGNEVWSMKMRLSDSATNRANYFTSGTLLWGYSIWCSWITVILNTLPVNKSKTTQPYKTYIPYSESWAMKSFTSCILLLRCTPHFDLHIDCFASEFTIPNNIAKYISISLSINTVSPVGMQGRVAGAMINGVVVNV